MTEPEDETRYDSEYWDEVVDVICVGSTPAVLAYLMACEARGLDVLHVESPAAFDADTVAYLTAMTEDLDATPDGGEPVTTRAAAAPLRRDARGRPDTLDPFVGERLRAWSARCVASPFAVLFTAVPDQFDRMRTADGEIITAMAIPDGVEIASATETFAGILYQEGRLAGALVTGSDGPCKVGARAGVALPIGPSGQWPRPGHPLALVSRPAGRFARLEVVLPDSGGHV